MIISDESLLRIQCVDVLPSEVDEIRHALESELNLSALAGMPGIGLAAPQIGIYKNMFIVRIPFGENIISIDVVNASIKHRYKPFLFQKEGCLSFPNKYIDTMRHNEVHVINNLVKPIILL